MKSKSQNQGFIEVVLLGVVVLGIAAIAGLWWYQGRSLNEVEVEVSSKITPTVAVGTDVTPTPVPSIETPTPTTTDVDVSDMDQLLRDASSDDFGSSGLSDTNLGL